MHQHDRWYRAPAAFCCRPSLLLWVKYGRYMIFIEMWTVDSPSDCTLWGWKMDLLRNSPFMLLFHLSSLPCSMTPWGAHSPIQIFFLWQLCRGKEEALGELILCQAALAVALISSWKSLGSAEDSAIDSSRSPGLPSRLTDYPRPAEVPQDTSFGIQLMEGQYSQRTHSPCQCPRWCQVFSPPTQIRRNSLIPRLVLFQQRKRKHFVFSTYFLHVFFLIFLFHFSLLLYIDSWVNQSRNLPFMKPYIWYCQRNTVPPSPHSAWLHSSLSSEGSLDFLPRPSHRNVMLLLTQALLKSYSSWNNLSNVCHRSLQEHRHFSSTCGPRAAGLSEPFLPASLQEFCHFKSLELLKLSPAADKRCFMAIT